MRPQFTEEELKAIKDYALELYLNGVSFNQIKKKVKERFGKGSHIAVMFLVKLPEDYKAMRKIAVSNKRISDEEKKRIEQFAIDLYLKGYGTKYIKRTVKRKFGRGVYYAIKAIVNLPREVKERHIEAYLDMIKDTYIKYYGEEIGLKMFERYKKKVLEKGDYLGI